MPTSATSSQTVSERTPPLGSLSQVFLGGRIFLLNVFLASHPDHPCYHAVLDFFPLRNSMTGLHPSQGPEPSFLKHLLQNPGPSRWTMRKGFLHQIHFGKGLDYSPCLEISSWLCLSLSSPQAFIETKIPVAWKGWERDQEGKQGIKDVLWSQFPWWIELWQSSE